MVSGVGLERRIPILALPLASVTSLNPNFLICELGIIVEAFFGVYSIPGIFLDFFFFCIYFLLQFSKQ